MDGAIDLGAKGAVVEALGRDLEIQCTVGIIGHQLDRTQLAALGSDLPATATQINNRPRHAIWQADLGTIRHPFYGDPHLLGLVLMHITRTAAGWLGIPGLQPQIQSNHIPFGTARLTLNVGDKGIPTGLTVTVKLPLVSSGMVSPLSRVKALSDSSTVPLKSAGGIRVSLEKSVPTGICQTPPPLLTAGADRVKPSGTP